MTRRAAQLASYVIVVIGAAIMFFAPMPFAIMGGALVMIAMLTPHLWRRYAKRNPADAGEGA